MLALVIAMLDVIAYVVLRRGRRRRWHTPIGNVPTSMFVRVPYSRTVKCVHIIVTAVLAVLFGTTRRDGPSWL